ncbi:hypothetical protein BDV10DRAFT_189454 [Aspergillus recurvatus]
MSSKREASVHSKEDDEAARTDRSDHEASGTSNLPYRKRRKYDDPSYRPYSRRVSHSAQEPEASERSSSNASQTQKDSKASAAAPPPKLLDPTITVIEAAETLYQLTKHRDGVPRQIHANIVNRIQGRETTAGNSLWSDGSIWRTILDQGWSENRRITIFNMLEFIGAWEWYDKQVKYIQQTSHVKRGKPVSERGAAARVLSGSVAQGKWVSGIGEVAIQDSKTQDGPGGVGITSQVQESQKKRFKMQLSRGRKLRTKLIEPLGLGGLGILFSPRIWQYTKMRDEELDTVTGIIQTDRKQMRLLGILSEQVQCLVDTGTPDLHKFYNSLEAELISETDIGDLMTFFSTKDDRLMNTVLETAVDRLLNAVRDDVLNGTSDEEKMVVVNHSPEIPFGSFKRLNGEKWLDAWIITAAMQISDKSPFVRHYHSIPLNEPGGNPIPRPLQAISQKVQQSRETSEEKLVHFCTLNHRRTHFTLLEINERERVIRHYDSMVSPDVMKGVKQSRMSRLVKSQFGWLGFEYTDAPTPQQNDDWSCGIRVIWNFKRISNGLSIGPWDKILDPKEMKLEIVEGFMACVQDNAMWKGRS